MKRKIWMVAIAFTFMISGVTSSIPNHAYANPDLQKELKKVKDKRKTVEKNKENSKGEIGEIKNKQQEVEEAIHKFDEELAQAEEDIEKKKLEIQSQEYKIAGLENEIFEMEESIAAREELFKDRVRSMQKNNGAIDYMNVLLGSKSFSDFLDRVRALNLIIEQDQKIIETYLDDKEALLQTKTVFEEALVQLEQDKLELNQLKLDLEILIDKNQTYLMSLKTDEKQLHSKIEELEELDEVLADQEQAIKRELEEWKRREAERKKSGDKPEITNGKFNWPATGTVTSSFGKRWGSRHHGIDIGKNGRNYEVAVVASANGTVFSSYYSRSYGHVVFITHNIGGQIYTTVYAHMKKRLAVKGERVKKGDVIGWMGNTGHSFGAHLHFELHKGMWNFSKSNAVNPLLYLNR